MLLKGEAALIAQEQGQDHALLCLFLQWLDGLSWIFLSESPWAQTLLLSRFSLSRGAAPVSVVVGFVVLGFPGAGEERGEGVGCSLQAHGEPGALQGLAAL